VSDLLIYALDPEDDQQPFPSLDFAADDPNGLLAIGGSLRPARLLNAYRHGVFPWFEDGQPILWWSPNPRLVLEPGHIHISRSLRKWLRQGRFRFSFDQAFGKVIRGCAEPRLYTEDTWITQSMLLAYEQMHELGHAHSIEVWQGQTLVGGLYAVSIGQVFFGESMFSRSANASKAGLAYLDKCLQCWNYQLIDCQMETEHLNRMGAHSIERNQFVHLLNEWCEQAPSTEAWQQAPSFQW